MNRPVAGGVATGTWGMVVLHQFGAGLSCRLIDLKITFTIHAFKFSYILCRWFHQGDANVTMSVACS